MSSPGGDKTNVTGTSPDHRSTLVDPKTITNRPDIMLEYLRNHGVIDLSPSDDQSLGRLRRKLVLHIVVLLGAINLMLFVGIFPPPSQFSKSRRTNLDKVDKSSLSYGAILGLLEDTHLTNTAYNNLNTIFYAGYVVGQLPGHYLIQRIPLRVYMSVTIFLWSVLIFLQCAAKSYGGLIPLRFLLGVVESPALPAMEMTLTMFFTPEEHHALQPIFWISCVGSPIPTGLIGYALLYTKSQIHPWRLFMIISGGLSLIIAFWAWCRYPDNPATAHFITEDEKIETIKKVYHATKSSFEQKYYKAYQAREALLDPISWLFFVSAFSLMISNNLAFQQSLLYLELGVTELGSTLVWVAQGGSAVIVSILAWYLLKITPGYSAFWAAFWCLPAIAGGIGMVALSWDKTIPLLACLLLASNTWGVTYIVMIGWASSSCAGYTKKLTRNALLMGAYGISNIISPQLWVSGGPRYYGTWIAQIIVSWVISPLCLLIVRWILIRRNKTRRVWIEGQATFGNSGTGFVDLKRDGGDIVREEVDISLLDLTDLENKFFIYPL